MDEFKDISTDSGILKVAGWKNYDIDWSKVTKLEDVINVLRGMRITVSLDENNPHPDFAPLMPYLKSRAE